MLAFITSKVGKYIAMAGTILAIVFTVLTRTKQAGRKEEQQAQLELQLDDIKKVRRIKDEISRLRNNNLDGRLDRWMRD